MFSVNTNSESDVVRLGRLFAGGCRRAVFEGMRQPPQQPPDGFRGLPPWRLSQPSQLSRLSQLSQLSQLLQLSRGLWHSLKKSSEIAPADLA